MLAFDLLWICSTTCCRPTARCTTNPQEIEVMEHRVCHNASICCGFVVQLVVQQIHNKSQLMESDIIWAQGRYSFLVRNPLSTFIFRNFFQVFFGLSFSDTPWSVELVWQCCHRFFSVCFSASSTVFFLTASARVSIIIFSITIHSLYCMPTSVYL